MHWSALDIYSSLSSKMHPSIKKIEPKTEIDRSLYNTWSKILKPEWIEVGELKTCMPVMYGEISGKMENFQVRPDDLFITSFPRSGTTWSQEMIWLISKDCDYENAKISIAERYPFMEVRTMFGNDQSMRIFDFFDQAEDVESPRFLKTHVPFNLLPRQIKENEVQPKIIYIMRNPKDVCVSFYHFTKTMCSYIGKFDEFCEQFLAGRIHYGPFWAHVFSYWNQRHRPNLLIIKYEEMKRNMPEVLKKVAKFLNKELTEDQIVELTDHLSFEKLKKNDYVNCENLVLHFRKHFTDDTDCEKFMRNGKIGGYKEEMSQEMIKRFDEWIEENTKGTDLHFD